MPDSSFKSDFTYRFYRDLLRTLKAKYEVVPLRAGNHQLTKITPVCYLRHDIDLSIDAAIPLAELEAGEGVSSTYMIIPNSPLYDLKSNAAQLRRLVDLGHEVALHFDIQMCDPPLSADDEAKLVAAIEEQCQHISELTGDRVESISFHRPMPIFLNGNDYVADRVNAYAKTLMACYRSDSKGSWRQGNPITEFQQQDLAPVAQILTHPIWWGEHHASAAARLDLFSAERTRNMDADGASKFDRLLSETVPGVDRSRNDGP